MEPTIGLEIHAELKTKTKLFCSSANVPEETRPNVHVCPICLGHPGTLPVLNRDAVQHVLRVGVALGGTLATFAEFDRKSYFYPDIPKGYQISEYEHPLVKGGSLAGISVTRVHLEEDTARSIHAGGVTLLDFNRSGIPLMELVTDPVIHSAEEAVRFARELQLLLRILGASDANLEKGEMRLEANISLGTTDAMGTKVEVKNLNSFRSLERAIVYELERQNILLSEGGSVIQETRGWDESREKTFSQRTKEGSADYRYFPEPDLPKLFLSNTGEWSETTLKASLPELPQERRARYQSKGFREPEVELLVTNSNIGAFFDQTCSFLGENSETNRLALNYLLTDIMGVLEGHSIKLEKIDPKSFASLVSLVREGSLSSRGAKEILATLVVEGGDPGTIAQNRGLLQSQDREALAGIVEKVLALHSSVASEYRAGKKGALEFLVGQAMKESAGSGNPSILRDLIKEKLR